MTHPRSLIFDHDGTLVDSLDLVVAATNSVLRGIGEAERDRDTIIAGMVVPTAARFARLISRPPAEYGELAARFYAEARRLGSHHVRLYPGIAECVHHLYQQGWKLAVLSNNEGALVRQLLGDLALLTPFDPVLGEEDVAQAKPARDGIDQILQSHGVTPERAVMIGDSASDIGAAQAAGIAAIAVGWGAHPLDELRSIGFKHGVDTAAELIAVAEQLVP